MSDTIVFHDLVAPEREPTPDESVWLGRVAAETNPADLVIRLAPSVIGGEPGPILQRALDGEWRAGRYIGELRREGRILQIRPRLDVAVIAAWASAALNVRIVPRAAEHHPAPTLIAELVAASWRSSLIEATRHGLPGLRAPRRSIGAEVRGRIDIERTLGLRAARRPAVASVHRPKQVDNPVSRVIVLADRVLDRRIARLDWRGDRVEEIMPRLRGAVGARPALPSARELHSVRYTPITQAYKRTAELSWQIARNRGLRASATGEKVEGLLVDVAELWELFLLHCARRAFGSGAVTHGTRLRAANPLLRSKSVAGAVLGRLYPDILLGAVDRPRAVIDAKYKPLAHPREVDREDLYQLASYLTGYDADPRPMGMLAYTSFPSQASVAFAEARNPWESAAGNEVRFERLPVAEAECVQRLRTILA